MAMFCFFKGDGDHRDLHLLTHSFPKRRSSDRLLEQNAASIAAGAGRALQVTAVSARDRGKARDVDLGGLQWFDDPVALARDVSAAVVVDMDCAHADPARTHVDTAVRTASQTVYPQIPLRVTQLHHTRYL